MGGYIKSDCVQIGWGGGMSGLIEQLGGSVKYIAVPARCILTPEYLSLSKPYRYNWQSFLASIV